MKIKVAINGFGRIGRNLFRLLLNHPAIEIVAINDIADKKTMAHLVKYDSIHGVLPFVVSHNDKGIIVDGKSYLFFHEKKISNLDWKSLSIDVVIESTGKFKTFEDLRYKCYELGMGLLEIKRKNVEKCLLSIKNFRL